MDARVPNTPHLFRFCAELGLGLELFGEDVLFLHHLDVFLLQLQQIRLLRLKLLGHLLQFRLLLVNLVLRVRHLQEGLDFCEEAPPLPVAQLQVGGTVALDDTNGVQLL